LPGRTRARMTRGATPRDGPVPMIMAGPGSSGATARMKTAGTRRAR
jgi:hypothetical protein